MNTDNIVVLILMIIYLVVALVFILVYAHMSFKVDHIEDINEFATNRDWLESLSDRDLVMLMLGGLADFSKISTNSQDFLEKWLDQEYHPEHMKMYFPYLDCFRDKSVNIF